jgi:mannose-6-phosphate isomerase-like protein (cupin superfamily)
MKFTLPHTIDNGHGEKLVFQKIVREPDGDKVVVEGFCQPGTGPIMHVHYRQDESLTVVKGKLGYQVLGQEPVFVGEGQTATFFRNEAHKFWNAGEEVLQITGWVKPADSIIFYLSTLFAAQKKSRSSQPEAFDGAYLLVRYKNEYGLPLLPPIVKKVVLPLTYQVGRLLGKYKKFRDAPEPL